MEWFKLAHLNDPIGAKDEIESKLAFQATKENQDYKYFCRQ